MSENFKDTLSVELYYVQRYKDTVLEVAKASALIPCEGADTEFARNMDNACGIDYVLISKDKGLSRGVGCRIQEDRWSEKYRTFTIRRGRDNGMKTEFAKRKTAIDGGGMYPYLTLQGYVDTANDRIDRLAIAKLRRLSPTARRAIRQLSTQALARVVRQTFTALTGTITSKPGEVFASGKT